MNSLNIIIPCIARAFLIRKKIYWYKKLMNKKKKWLLSGAAGVIFHISGNDYNYLKRSFEISITLLYIFPDIFF